MNRRSILKSLGATTVAGSAVLGSGALTQVTAQRNVTISVTNDNNSAVKLSANNTAASGAFATIDQGSSGTTSAGQLTFDTGDLNADSQLLVGDADNGSGGLASTISSYAFTIEDQLVNDVTGKGLGVSISVSTGDSTNSGLGLAFAPTGSSNDLTNSNTANWKSAEQIAGVGLKNSEEKDTNLPVLPERYQDSDNLAKNTDGKFLLDEESTVGAELLVQADDEDAGNSPKFTIEVTAESVDTSS